MGLNKRKTEDYLENFRASNPDLIFVFGSRAALDLLKVEDNTPVIYSMVLNPITAKTIGKGDYSGKNTTGIALMFPADKQLALFKRIAPKLERVGYSTEILPVF